MDVDYVNINQLPDAEVALRMRKLNYEKFKTLVRMHLSFELDLNTDEFDLPCHEIVYEDKGKLKKWNRLSKKHRHHAGITTTGCASTSKGSASAENSPVENLHQQINAGFMLHLLELKEFLLLEKNLTQEGIFRKTGSTSRQNELRQQIQNDKPLDLEAGGYSAHDCATVFKGYLADLPEPLLTDAHYPAHSQIAPLCIGATLNVPKPMSAERTKRDQHLLNSMQLLLLLLPDENRQLLQHIIDILHAVAEREPINKMSPDNLATLFAPHLICPRNLPPEALHYVSRKMSSIIAYMVCKGGEIFELPSKLSTDIRAYFHERKRKKTMSPEQTLDESISDISTVNTVYTFVDREKTAAAHTTNTTDTELAQLYAHIQSLPESSKKRRLIKQFNKQNGQGTPLQLVVMNRLKNSDATRSAKSISDSIKKHIFHKGIMSRTPKRSAVTATPTASNFGTPNYSTTKNPKMRVLFQSPAPSVNVCMSMSINTQTPSSTSSSTLSSTIQQFNSSTTCAETNPMFVTKNRPASYNYNQPLKKSISSSSLLVNSSSSSTSHSNPVVQSDESESSSSSSLSSSVGSLPLVIGTDTTPMTTMTKTVESVYCMSAPVSRQVSSDLSQSSVKTDVPYHSMGLNTSSGSSHSSGSYSQHFQTTTEVNCCGVTMAPFKLINEAAKLLLHSDSGNSHGCGKTVARDDKELLQIHEDSEGQHSPSELKTRYKSEPNLSCVLSPDELIETGMPNASNNEACHKASGDHTDHSSRSSFTRKLIKGMSMGNLKFPFSTPESTKRLVRSVSSTLRRRSNDDQLHRRTASDVDKTVMPPSVNVDDNEEDLDDETFEEQPADNLGSDSSDVEEEDDDIVDGNERNDDGSSEEVALLAGAAGNSSSNELPSCSSNTMYQQILLQQSGIYRNMDLITSTPSLLLGRRSMSPITKSTQRMPKAMQESIMTPRSRKPVMVLTTTLSSSDPNQTTCQMDLSSFREKDEDQQSDSEIYDDDIDSIRGPQLPPPSVHDEDAISVDSYTHMLSRRPTSHTESFNVVTQDSAAAANTNAVENDALSNNFKQYLLRRSVYTASPVDLSFASQPDDFGSTQEIEDFDDSQLSPSLLYCLDGHQPDKQEQGGKDGSNKTDQEASSNNHLYKNRISNNPFILLNNARKRAATSDLEKATTSPSNNDAISNTKTTQTENKENVKIVEGYRRSRKMLISDYPGETSF